VALASAGRERGSSSSAQSKDETPHEVIMAIKKRVGAKKQPLILTLLVYLLIITLVALGIFFIVAIGKYISIGRPNGEEFVPFVLRMFILPLMERFPALQVLLGQ
jgi:hypothetical protein